MLVWFRAVVLTLTFIAAPMTAIAQVSTPTPACPDGEYVIAGAMRIIDGAVAWSACSPVEAFRTVYGVSDDVLLLDERGPSGDHTVALSPLDGSELWRRATARFTHIPAGPIDSQGIVVLATNDAGEPALVGVDVESGDDIWRMASTDHPLALGETVVVVGDTLQQFGPAPYRGLDRATGEELWVSDVPFSNESRVMVARAPLAVLEDVVVVQSGATITAIDMLTGAALWDAPRLDHPTAVDGVILGVEGADAMVPEVVALDSASGESLWKERGSPSYGGILAVGDEEVIAIHLGGPELVAYEVTSGAERWRIRPATRVEPQLISGTTLIGMWEGEIAAFSTTDGATIWSATEPFGSPFMNSAGSNRELVFVAINSLPWGD